MAPGRQPLGTWLQACLDRWATRHKLKTQADYAYKCGYILPHLGATPLADLTYDAIEAMLLRLLRDGIAYSTVNQIRNHLNRALEEACKRRYIEHNVCPQEMPVPAPAPREPIRLTFAQAAQLLAVADADAPMLWMFLLYGLREGEVNGLRRGDIGTRTITIAQQITTLHSKAHVETPKSADGRRVLPLSPELAALLDQHLQSLIRRAATQTRWQEHGLAFPSRYGTPGIGRSFDKRIKRLLVRAGLDPAMHVHDLRHTAAAFYTAIGAPEVVRAAIAGHKPRSITDHYGDPDTEAMRPWVERVERKLRRELANVQAA